METLDQIVFLITNSGFCASMGDERCPAIVDVVIRQGLPMLVEAGTDGDFSQVLCYFVKVLIPINFVVVVNTLNVSGLQRGCGGHLPC